MNKITIRHIVCPKTGRIVEQRMLFGMIPVNRRYLDSDVRKAEANMLASKSKFAAAAQAYSDAKDAEASIRKSLKETTDGFVGSKHEISVTFRSFLKFFEKEGLFPKQDESWKKFYDLMKKTGAVNKGGVKEAVLVPATVASVPVAEMDHVANHGSNQNGNNNQRRKGGNQQNNGQQH